MEPLLGKRYIWTYVRNLSSVKVVKLLLRPIENAKQGYPVDIGPRYQCKCMIEHVYEGHSLFFDLSYPRDFGFDSDITISEYCEPNDILKEIL